MKLPFRSRLLSWWDSAQFGLALERFSVIEHRPHPPGYPLYILAGKFLTFINNDPALSFVLIGLVCSTVATVLVFFIATELRRSSSVGWLAASIYAFAPLTFFHELKALTYVIGAFFSALVVWEAIRIIKGSEKSFLRISLALGIMGMVRPYESILLLPLFIWTLWRLGFGRTIFACLIYIVFQVVWIVPIALLCSGFQAYLHEVLSEFGKHQRNISSVASNPLDKLITNWKAIYYYIRQSFPFWGFLLFIPIIKSILFRKRDEFSWLLFLWIAPAFALYMVNNVNYAGIPIFISPVIAVLIAISLDTISKLTEKYRIKITSKQLGRSVLNCIFAGIVAIHFLSIFFSFDVRIFGESHRRYDPSGFNYHKLLAGDGYIYMLKQGVEDIATQFGGPDSVLLLSDTNYRVLMYYLDDFKIVWTRYLSQKQSSVDGVTKIAFGRNDSMEKLPSVEYNGKKYWYFKVHDQYKIAIFTDEMLPNLKDNSRIFQIPGVEAAKAFALDLDDAYAVYFSYREFGVIDNTTAEKIGIKKDDEISS